MSVWCLVGLDREFSDSVPRLKNLRYHGCVLRRAESSRDNFAKPPQDDSRARRGNRASNPPAEYHPGAKFPIEYLGLNTTYPVYAETRCGFGVDLLQAVDQYG